MNGGRPGRDAEGGLVERWDPDQSSHNLIQAEHEARYWFAAKLADGRECLDVGCGAGYGAAILAAGGAGRVVGVDRDPAAIAAAQRRVPVDATFLVGDALRLPLSSDEFDLAVCFEMIEHVLDGTGVIAEIRRVLRPNGIAVVSSPNRDVYLPGNPHHLHEFKPEELRQALAREFSHVSLHRQSAWITSLITTDEGARTEISDRPLLGQVRKVCAVDPGAEVYTVALASDQPLPALEGEAVLADTFEVTGWSDRVAALEEHIRQLEMQLQAQRRATPR